MFKEMHIFGSKATRCESMQPASACLLTGRKHETGDAARRGALRDNRWAGLTWPHIKPPLHCKHNFGLSTHFVTSMKKHELLCHDTDTYCQTLYVCTYTMNCSPWGLRVICKQMKTSQVFMFPEVAERERTWNTIADLRLIFYHHPINI